MTRKVACPLSPFAAHVVGDSPVANVIFFASRSALHLPPGPAADDANRRRVALPSAGAILIEDDFNPLEFLFAEANLEFRRPRTAAVERERNQ